MNGKIFFILFLSLLMLWMCGNKKEPTTENTNEIDLSPKFPIKGEIVFQSNLDGDNEIYSISNIGLKKLTDNTWEDEHPMWSPDGKQIAFTANPEGSYDIFIMNADGSNINPLTSFPLDENWATWFPDGKSIVFTRQIKKFLRKSVQVFRIDLLTKETKRIIPQYSKGLVIPHMSPKAPLLTLTGKRTIGWDVAVFDMNKNELKFLDEGGKSCRARFSEDGKKLAYVSSKADKKGDIWLMNPDGSGKTRLTKRDDTYDYFPSWSPDNNYIVFNSSHQHDHNGDWKLYIIEVNSREVFFLFDSPGNDVFPDWR